MFFLVYDSSFYLVREDVGPQVRMRGAAQGSWAEHLGFSSHSQVEQKVGATVTESREGMLGHFFQKSGNRTSKKEGSVEKMADDLSDSLNPHEG